MFGKFLSWIHYNYNLYVLCICWQCKLLFLTMIQIWPLFPVISVRAAVKNEKLSHIINVLCKCFHLICNMAILLRWPNLIPLTALFDRYFRSYRSERRSKMKNYRILSMFFANAFIWYTTWLYYGDDPIWSLWPPYLTAFSRHSGQSGGQKWKIIAYYQCPLQMLSFDMQHDYLIETILYDRPSWPLFPVIAVKPEVKN